MSSLFLHCRPGFEPECAAEIEARAGTLEVAGRTLVQAGSGYVVFEPNADEPADELIEKIAFRALVFARQWFAIRARCEALPRHDRVAALAEAAAGTRPPAGELFIETPDTNEAKTLSPLCRSIAHPLEAALRKRGALGPADSSRRLHVCFVATDIAYVGYASRDNSSPWPMGVPRLRFPRGAPSRSTLKLEEALLYFLREPERARLLKAGTRAVDLGAAPGGWTHRLVQRGLLVTAVDNGRMDRELMSSGLVEHRREDGFRYRPPKPVEWMVCDIAEQPIRIAALAAQWLARGWCRRTIFNLKLPMKKRYAELQRCLELIRRELKQAGVRYAWAAKQLYHDRDEVTVFLYRRER
jgi:23S rRNA (cytidine2498-2'-O)-methyltransferase